MRLLHRLLLLVLVFPSLAAARQSENKLSPQLVQAKPVSENQESSQKQKKNDSMQRMPRMDHDEGRRTQVSSTNLVTMRPETFLQEIVRHASSGTSAEPDSTPTPMLMTTKGMWTVMFHANAFVLDEQQSSPRGGDKLFSTNWFMPMVQRGLGPGVFTARVMLSLEPATITGRRYPLLFQQGETAYGDPIVDGQHPHNFFMEVAALYDWKLADKTLLSFYFAPVGDPALGPTAFPHRFSAFEDPLATLGHHQEDSTHIADDVGTIGLTYGIARIEVSGFHGREPNEFRWGIDQGQPDSWSTRLTIQPGTNWSAQYSYGRIESPEALFPGENQERMTASVMYNRPLHNGNWANTILWGRTQSLQDDSIFNSYLLESLVRFRARNYAWTRIEEVDRSNELVLGENPLPPGFQEEAVGRVQAYTFGYDHDFDWIPHVAIAPGAQFTGYGVADTLKPIYGSHPFGVAIFLRFRPFSGEER
ncbi:MAG: hypothetical protein ACRD4C_04015 [Candidatus Acidiferrales bacterium]